MGNLLSCIGQEYEPSGAAWQASSKWPQQSGVIAVEAETQNNAAAYHEHPSPLQPSPNIQMLQIPSPPQRPAPQISQNSPTELATQKEQQDAFPDENNLPQAPVNWKKGDLIGAGAFGRVYLGMNNDNGELIAIKQVTVSTDTANANRVAQHVRELEREVSVLKQLNHPNIVRYLGTDRSQDCLNIFLEYVPGGSIASLLSKFGSFKEKVIKIYARQILTGLQYLHDHKIMHRDIKGANILVDKAGFVKLADFGASKIIEDLVTIDSGVKSIKGTSYWMAPEVIKQTGHGRMADIWSVGCTVIEMATGKPPWSQFSSQVSAMFHIASSKGPPPIPEHLSPEAKDFLLLCFIRTPQDRPNAARLLNHPFLADALRPSASGQLPDPIGIQSPYKVPIPARLVQEGGRDIQSKSGLHQVKHVFDKEKLLQKLNPIPLATGTRFSTDQDFNTGLMGAPQEKMVQKRVWPNHDAALRHSVASKASTRYDGVDENEACSNLDAESRRSDSDYNPVEEPSWLQQDSLQASSFYYGMDNISPLTSPLRNANNKLGTDFRIAAKYAPPQRRDSAQDSLEEHLTYVQAKASHDVTRLSTVMKSSKLRDLQGTQDKEPSSKQQQWEAELLEELAEQRNMARRI